MNTATRCSASLPALLLTSKLRLGTDVPPPVAKEDSRLFRYLFRSNLSTDPSSGYPSCLAALRRSSRSSTCDTSSLPPTYITRGADRSR
eukprot:scaffold31_cov263-Pinguiococcus_pyrenoidosus.AAC.43